MRAPHLSAAPKALFRLVVSVALVVTFSAMAAAPAGAQEDELAAARRRANEAAQALADAETALGELDLEIEANERSRSEAQAVIFALDDEMRSYAVSRYMDARGGPSLEYDDLNGQVIANALADHVSRGSHDDLDAYEAAVAQLEDADAALAEAREEQERLRAELDTANENAQRELARLEELERQRREEEERRRREEEERRRQEEAAAQQRATESARRQTTTTSSPSSSSRPTTVTNPVGANGFLCPVQGAVSFVDSWGAPRSGGRTHKGVDMLASTGTPAVAPVSGTVEHRGNSVGGLSYHLNGDDGNYYYGTHLSAYGASGHVEAGAVIGYVGDTGNARGTPHLHFEIHPGGQGNPVNPYPTVAAAC